MKYTVLLATCVQIQSALVCAPPKQPPVNKLVTYGPEEWKLQTIDSIEASTTAAFWSQEYDEEYKKYCPERLGLKPISTPQGFLGLTKHSTLHAIVHFLELSEGVATMDGIYVPLDETEAFSVLAMMIESNKETLKLEWDTLKREQPRTAMVMMYQNKE